ncbi:MAG: hypothetical protein ACYSU7_17045 [Planctomycetota bacterium]
MRPDSWGQTGDTTGRLWRFEEARCAKCGYDLQGLPTPDDAYTCPECGADTQRCDAVVRQKDQNVWWRWCRVPVLIILAGFLLWHVVRWATVFIVPVFVFVALYRRWLRPLFSSP